MTRKSLSPGLLCGHAPQCIFQDQLQLECTHRRQPPHPQKRDPKQPCEAMWPSSRIAEKCSGAFFFFEIMVVRSNLSTNHVHAAFAVIITQHPLYAYSSGRTRSFLLIWMAHSYKKLRNVKLEEKTVMRNPSIASLGSSPESYLSLGQSDCLRSQARARGY